MTLSKVITKLAIFLDSFFFQYFACPKHIPEILKGTD